MRNGDEVLAKLSSGALDYWPPLYQIYATKKVNSSKALILVRIS
jgi:hypothetical protein